MGKHSRHFKPSGLDAPACVTRPAPKKEYAPAGEWESACKARGAMAKQWPRPVETGVSPLSGLRAWP